MKISSNGTSGKEIKARLRGYPERMNLNVNHTITMLIQKGDMLQVRKQARSLCCLRFACAIVCARMLIDVSTLCLVLDVDPSTNIESTCNVTQMRLHH